MEKEGEIIIFKSKSGEVKIETRLKDDTIWLTQQQIADLFDVDRTVISKHIKNIFNNEELIEKSTYAIFAHMGTKGDSRKRKYETKYYNLDMIISVGYRVNSKKATDFRIWATKTLKNYLVKGYTINDKKFYEIQSIIQFITAKAKNQGLIGHEKEILDVIEKYSKTWKLLGEYDEGNIQNKRLKRSKFKLNYYACHDLIEQLKQELFDKKIIGNLFGLEREESLEGIIGNIYQTFQRKELYNSIEEKAAHLLYFVIKDHPFSDGNKRIGSLLFLYFLEKNNFLFKSDGLVKIGNKTIVALALLIASSDPREKESIVNLIINLIQD